MASQITTNPKPVNDVSLPRSTAKGAFIQGFGETIKWVIVKRGEKITKSCLNLCGYIWYMFSNVIKASLCSHDAPAHHGPYFWDNSNLNSYSQPVNRRVFGFVVEATTQAGIGAGSQ